ncbi:MAG: hypothetical protein QFE16_00100 [Pseudomonadota bacterium]|nr:hypothetical protein [Pseudomonadota bacterium]
MTAHSRSAPRTLVVGAGERFRTLHEAVRAADSGDVIEIQPGEYHGDVSVIDAPHLTIRGLGPGAVFHAEGQHAEGKAMLVVRGDVAIENIEFRGARVPVGNGAGIRFEQGRLALRRCRFFDNEMGILTANEADMVLDVVDCEFGAAPRHEGMLHHLLYVGAIGAFSIQGSRFSQGWRGHLLKSRALHNRVINNRLDDRPDGEASYELEFPNGGHNVVVGNLIAQSAQTQNPDLLSMGAEARDGMTGSLVLANNTFINAASAHARFVHVWTDRLAGEVPVSMTNNLFVGAGQLHLPPIWDGGGNRRLDLDAFAPPSR